MKERRQTILRNVFSLHSAVATMKTTHLMFLYNINLMNTLAALQGQFM